MWKFLAAMTKGALVCGLVTGCAVLPEARLARGQSYVLAGTGRPTAVLQSGLGDGKAVWAGLLPSLAERRQVFAYDRPGYGDSPAAPAQRSRDPCTVAEELHALLREAGVAPPYLLVGHSLGGLYQYAFARLFPAEVAGLVLLDPTHPQHWRRMQAEAPAAASLLNGLRATPLFTATMRREFEAQDQCQQRLAAQPPLTLPVRLLVRTRYAPPEHGAFEALVHELERDWLRQSGAPRVEAVEGSGHYIQSDRPAAVLAAIEALARP